MRPLASLAAALVVSCCLAVVPARAQGRPGVDFSPSLVPIVPGVYVWEGPLPLAGEAEVVRTNSLVVVTPEGVVVVDGQDTLEEGRRLLAAIRTVTALPVRYLINASPHGDHVNSNAAFDGATIVAHDEAYAAMAAANARAADPAGRLPLPHLTYRDRMDLRLGGVHLELHYFGRGHTRGDTVVFLPAQQLAFLSELYFNGVFASLGEGYARDHLVTLDRARALPAAWWIPGHGHVKGQSQAQLAEGLSRYRANVQAIHDAVARRIARGETLDQVLAGIDADLGEFASLPFYRYLKPGCVSGTYKALSATK
jgi:glyoxylase-like metal-dependent hydrolase (beta-lactamase superfamily II)